MDRFRFHPCLLRTAAVDLAVRERLADSVATVLQAATQVGLTYPGDADAWRRHLLAHKGAPPAIWAGYHALVQAALRADQAAFTATATDLMQRLPAAPTRPGTIVTVSEADLGEVDVSRYVAVIDNDPVRPLELRPADAESIARVSALAVEARSLLAESSAALLDEIDTLAHQIVLATNASRSFGGAATVFLWGGVVLNPDRMPDRVTMVESLAHESAHALLFGLTLGADLTTNDPAERYASPLRPDPRPIEGIVHATYVLARMNYALRSLLRSPHLTAAELALIDAKLARNRASYESGLATVEAHARLTADGAAIFTACRRGMETAD